MMTIKHAFLNIVRMPVRSLLFSAAAFLMIFTLCFSMSTASVSDRALRTLDHTYPFAATIIAKTDPSSDGTVNTAPRLNLDMLCALQGSEAVSTYNFRLYAGTLAEDEILSVLPDDTILEKEPVTELDDPNGGVYAVNELYLEQEFMGGSYRITEGSSFTQADICGGNRAMILSETIAEKYGLKPGDTVNYKFGNRRCYISCIVRGIFRERSGQPVLAAYIPLSDYCSTAASVLQGLSRADHTGYLERSLDAVSRIDFLLENEDAVSDFLYDARDAGLDFSKYEILVNDRAYHTAASGISEIRTISVFVLVLTAVGGCIILYAILAFYRRTRAKETLILHNLGMRHRQIYAIYFCEYLFLTLAAAILALGIGTVSSNTVIRYLDETYVAALEENANRKEPSTNEVLSFRSSVLSYPVRMDFGKDSESVRLPFLTWRAAKAEGEPAVRYEQFCDDKNGKQIVLRGCETENPGAGYGKEIFYEMNRMSGLEFPCYVPENAGYAVGDVISVSRFSDRFYSMMRGNEPGDCSYFTPPTAIVTLRAAGISSSGYYEVGFDDLTMICTYLGISSDRYRNIRYDTYDPFTEDTETGETGEQ